MRRCSRARHRGLPGQRGVTFCRVLQQRQGLSTGLASSVSSSKTATLTRSWKATQTRTMRKARHTWLDEQRRNAAKGHRTAKSRALIKPTNPPATKLKHSPNEAAGLHTSQSLPNLTRGSGARATPLAPRVAQHEAGHQGLHPAVTLVEDSAQLLQHPIDELILGERAEAGLTGCAAEPVDESHSRQAQAAVSLHGKNE